MTVKVWIFWGCTNQPYERTWDWWLQRNILICTGLLPLSLYYVHTHAHQCIKLPRPCASQGSSFFFILQASTDWGCSCAEESHCLLPPLAPFSITLTLIHCIVVIIILAIITFFSSSSSHIHFFLSVLCLTLPLCLNRPRQIPPTQSRKIWKTVFSCHCCQVLTHSGKDGW